MKQKARIYIIGNVHIHEPDEFGFTATLSEWGIEGPTDFPAFDPAAGRMGGWTVEELGLISDVAHAVGYETALELAERHRMAREEPAPV